MFDIKTSLLILVTITNTAIGVGIFAKRRKQPARLAFFCFTLGISLWALTNALFQLTTDPALGKVFALASYYAALILSVSFFAFSANFPHPLTNQKLLQLVLLGYTLIWGSLIAWPDVTLVNVVYDPVGRIITGPGVYFYGASICLFLFGGVAQLWHKRRTASLLERRQVEMITVGMVISAAIGVLCNLLLPLFGNYQWVWLGPDASLLLVAFMAYAIVKHRLFNIRILAVEIFAGLLGLFIVVEWLQSSTQLELILRGLTVAAYAFLGWQLLSSVHKEIKARETLEDLLEQKTDFINMASHQLRTPLTAIRGLLTMLYEGDYDQDPVAKQKQVQKNILISVDRLSNSVNDILSAAELEKGVVAEFVVDDVSPLVELCIKILEPNFKKNSVQLNYQATTKPLPKVSLRAKYLQQAFLNLIDNAQRYTPSGGRVDVSISSDGDQVVVSIKDSGIGIAPEDQAKMFNKFYRADNAKNIQTSGTGLGLYIVRKIVEEHHGIVQVHSAGLNQGTTFSISLPAVYRS